MKKRLIQFMLVMGLMVLTCAAAQATETPPSGFRNRNVVAAYADFVTLTPLTAAGGSVTASDGAYPGAAKMEVVYKNPQSNSEYLLVVLTDTNAPTADNMAYIDQKTASGAEVTFTIYPKAPDPTATSVTYHVYMSSNADAESTGVTEYAEVASFEYYGEAAEADVLLGDVNNDTEVDAGDAVAILEYVVGITEVLDSRQQKAGDVNHDTEVDAGDAVTILEYVVGIRDRNFELVA